MSGSITSPDDLERVKYIAEMLAELDEMARGLGQSELSLLIGVAAVAAVELEQGLGSPLCEDES